MKIILSSTYGGGYAMAITPKYRLFFMTYEPLVNLLHCHGCLPDDYFEGVSFFQKKPNLKHQFFKQLREDFLKAFGNHIEFIFSNIVHDCAWSDLKLYELEPNRPFTIESYDGFEKISYADELDWYILEDEK